jgi:hypothetical protein
MYAQGCETLEQARIQTFPGAPGTGEDEDSVAEKFQQGREGKYRAGIRGDPISGFH